MLLEFRVVAHGSMPLACTPGMGLGWRTPEAEGAALDTWPREARHGPAGGSCERPARDALYWVLSPGFHPASEQVAGCTLCGFG